MRLSAYVSLTKERKLKMIQRDEKQVMRDLLIYKKLGQAAPVLGEAFRVVNGWWNRPVNRSKEDYALAQAYLIHKRVKEGHHDAMPTVTELLREELYAWQDKIHGVICQRIVQEEMSTRTRFPERGDADAIQEFWNRYAAWPEVIRVSGLSGGVLHRYLKKEQAQQVQLNALSRFWDADFAEKTCAELAYKDHDSDSLRLFFNAQADILKYACGALGAVTIPDFQDNAESLHGFLIRHRNVLAKTYEYEDGPEKARILQEGQLELAEAALQEAAEKSLRPEGRYQKLRDESARLRGDYIITSIENLPPKQSLRQELAQEFTTFFSKDGLKDIPYRMRRLFRKKRHISLAILIGASGAAGFAALKKEGASTSEPKQNSADMMAPILLHHVNDVGYGYDHSIDADHYSDGLYLFKTFETEEQANDNTDAVKPIGLRDDAGSDILSPAQDSLALMHRNESDVLSILLSEQDRENNLVQSNIVSLLSRHTEKETRNEDSYDAPWRAEKLRLQ